MKKFLILIVLATFFATSSIFADGTIDPAGAWSDAEQGSFTAKILCEPTLSMPEDGGPLGTYFNLPGDHPILGTPPRVVIHFTGPGGDAQYDIEITLNQTYLMDEIFEGDDEITETPVLVSAKAVDALTGGTVIDEIFLWGYWEIIGGVDDAVDCTEPIEAIFTPTKIEMTTGVTYTGPIYFIIDVTLDVFWEGSSGGSGLGG